MFPCGKWMVGGMPFCCVPNTIAETGNAVRNKTDPGPALREHRVEQAEVRNFALTSLYNHLSILLIYMCSQSYGFSSSHVWMWKMDPKEGWAPKNWYFELWCWRRLLRVPWTARRSNQSILKKINPEYSLEGLMLKLKLQYLATWCDEPKYWKRPWSWEGLGAGGEGDDRGWDGWMASPTRWTWVWVNSGRWWWTGRPGMLWFIGSQRVGHDWATELNWTALSGVMQKSKQMWYNSWSCD